MKLTYTACSLLSTALCCVMNFVVHTLCYMAKNWVTSVTLWQSMHVGGGLVTCDMCMLLWCHELAGYNFVVVVFCHVGIKFYAET